MLFYKTSSEEMILETFEKKNSQFNFSKLPLKINTLTV